MKSIARYLIPAAVLAALPGLHAGDPSPSGKKEMRVIVNSDSTPQMKRHLRRLDGPQEKETVTFLGVETQPADAALAAQLNLAKGTGLVVREVVPESPASALLKRNDVLVKFDDQLLIDQRQLSVLIRNHQEGDEVTLTFMRGGKEMTSKVKLAKHEVAKMAMLDHFPAPGMFTVPLDHAEGMDREDMDRVLSLMDQHKAAKGVHRIRVEPRAEPGMRSTTVSVDNSNMVYSDESGSLELTIKDGKKTLVAKNAKGAQLFSGPVTTPEERKAVPAEVRERLDKLEGMQEFSFQTDDDFEGGRVEVVKPGKTKIALPQVTPAPRGSPSF